MAVVKNGPVVAAAADASVGDVPAAVVAVAEVHEGRLALVLLIEIEPINDWIIGTSGCGGCLVVSTD